MDNTPSREMLNALEAAFEHFNGELFKGKLPPLFLNLSRCSNKRVMGFFAWEAWKKGEGYIWELSLTPRCTSKPAKDVFGVLVHEMAHELDELNGTRPRSPGWHGKAWFKIMREVGLEPRPNGKSRVSVHHEVIEGGAFDKAFFNLPEWVRLPFISPEGSPDPFVVGPGEPEGIGEPIAEPKSKSGLRAKYLCEGCGTTMRGPFGRKLICGDCGREYQELGA